MSYEQKRESWKREVNPELDLLQIRIDDIVSFVDKKVIGAENSTLSSLFEKEKNWKDELVEIKSLLDDARVKTRMVEKSDYSDMVGNFYNLLFIFFKRIEAGKPINGETEIVRSVKTKTTDFLDYLRNFETEERKVA